MDELHHLEAQYRHADDLLLSLARVELLRALRDDGLELLEAAARERIGEATSKAFRRVIRWQAGGGSPLRLVAREAVVAAVAAQSLRTELPDVAEWMASPWTSAVRVRTHLRGLGAETELVADRLLPTWRLPVEQMPAAAAAVAAPVT